MKQQLMSSFVATAAAVAMFPCVGATPAYAQSSKLSQALSQFSRALEAEQQDQAIKQAFSQVLDRQPTDSELRRYRGLMHEEHWTERDVRDDLSVRTDYRRHAPSNSTVDPDRVIRRAYEDILNRAPDAQGLRTYRSHMIDDGWTEQDVRQALRRSAEHADVRQDSADRIIKRAYQDELGRDPDFRGLMDYRNQVMHHGWDEHDVRMALRRSPEYRQKNQMTRDQAVAIVQRAYRSVLHRDADPGGMEGYVQGVLRDHWTEAEIARDLRSSDEYRNAHR